MWTLKRLNICKYQFARPSALTDLHDLKLRSEIEAVRLYCSEAVSELEDYTKREFNS